MASLLKRSAMTLALGAAAATVASTAALAHVKWFCAFDVAGQPVGLENVLCPDFESLTLLSMAALAGGAVFERTGLGTSCLRLLDMALVIPRRNAELFIRGVMGAFLVALWTLGGIMLTPELKTDAQWVPLLQLAMAGSLLHRKTMVFASIGIVVLYGTAIHDFGIFHMLDYPIFLGLAAYVALRAFNVTPWGYSALTILRWSAAVTLMWASIEKWAYPEWTYPLFVTHADMTLGLDPDFYMRAAGAVEFALAFGLAWTPLVRRVSAMFLIMIFVSAIAPFGKIDAIGHSCIIAVLVAIATEPTDLSRMHVMGKSEWRRWLAPAYAMPLGYPVALVVFLAGYYGLHAGLYHTTVL